MITDDEAFAFELRCGTYGTSSTAIPLSNDEHDALCEYRHARAERLIEELKAYGLPALAEGVERLDEECLIKSDWAARVSAELLQLASRT